MKILNGMVAIVTGGNGFLGQQYVKVLKTAGAETMIWDCSGDQPVDITKKDQIEQAVEIVLEKFGRIDILINNAALNPAPNDPEAKDQFLPYENYPLELWNRELAVGLTGSLLCTQAVAPAMTRQKRGVIVNVGSHYGLVAPDNRIYPEGMCKSIGYATTKGALPNFTRAWAGYLGPYGVRVNCLVLGGVFHGHDPEFVKKYSEKTMLGRMALENEYVGAMLFLVSSSSSYMTGQSLVIDGGWTAW